MVHNVLSLHKIAAAQDVIFPIPIKDYQRYIFGDDRLAHRFGTDLAKVFVAQGPGSTPPLTHATSATASNGSCTTDFAVAVVSGHVPAATHSLRNHFVAHLNRHLVAVNARPATKIDLASPTGDDVMSQGFHIDAKSLGARMLIVLADIRTTGAQEAKIRTSLQNTATQGHLANSIVFAYILQVADPAIITKELSPIMAHVISPSVKEVEIFAQAKDFTMNDCFVQWVLGREYAEFCQFIRRQDDGFVRLLLNYAIAGGYYGMEDFKDNVGFLGWEIEARESV